MIQIHYYEMTVPPIYRYFQNDNQEYVQYTNWKSGIRVHRKLLLQGFLQAFFCTALIFTFNIRRHGEKRHYL